MRPCTLELTLPPGAELLASGDSKRFTPVGNAARGVRLRLDTDVAKEEVFELRHRPGIEIETMNEPLQPGDESRRLRIIDALLEGETYVARLQGRSGRAYRLRLDVPFAVRSVSGAREVSREGSVRILEVPFPPSPSQWGGATLRMQLGAREAATR